MTQKVNGYWVVLALAVVFLVVAPLAMAGGRDVATGSLVTAQSGTLLGPYPALKPEVEEVFIQQTLRAMHILGWNRGAEWDSHVDWLAWREYTFRPWDWGYPREDWYKSPGQRHAEFGVRYCVINCDNYQCEPGTGPCAVIEAQLANEFDIALYAVTAR